MRCVARGKVTLIDLWRASCDGDPIMSACAVHVQPLTPYIVRDGYHVSLNIGMQHSFDELIHYFIYAVFIYVACIV
jgi:hypothetical protein